MSSPKQPTQGDWEFDGEAYIWAVVNGQKKMIAEIRGEGWGAPQAANAKLLAAAPRMLRALKAIKNEIIFKGLTGGVESLNLRNSFNEAIAAIREAEL